MPYHIICTFAYLTLNIVLLTLGPNKLELEVFKTFPIYCVILRKTYFVCGQWPIHENEIFIIASFIWIHPLVVVVIVFLLIYKTKAKELHNTCTTIRFGIISFKIYGQKPYCKCCYTNKNNLILTEQCYYFKFEQRSVMLEKYATHLSLGGGKA